MADPVAAVKRIYTYFGRELSSDGEHALRRWQQENPQHKHGRHVYSKSEVGVNESEILDRFAPYMEHYGMKPERAVGS